MVGVINVSSCLGPVSRLCCLLTVIPHVPISGPSSRLDRFLTVISYRPFSSISRGRTTEAETFVFEPRSIHQYDGRRTDYLPLSPSPGVALFPF